MRLAGIDHVRARRGAAAIAVALTALGCRVEATTPSRASVSCPLDRSPAYATAECGSVRVWEDRHAKHGRQLDVFFARWPAAGRQPATTAVFLLAGGPGESGANLSGAAEGWARPLRDSIDIVVVDQRGTGLSNPLRCPNEVEARPASAFGRIFDRAGVRQCRTELEARADLQMYTTELAADDLDDVRAELGYERISVYGASYGTRLAQAYMRQHPDRISAVVLDGTMPLDLRAPLTYAATAQHALDRVFERCGADPPCRRRHAGLRADFEKVLARFDAGPVATTVTTADGRIVPVAMSRGDFGYAVRGILYASRSIDRLPDWIAGAATTGDVSAFAQRYWERAMSFGRGFANGLHLSILCSEDVAFIEPVEIAGATAGTFLGQYVIDEYRGACALWPVAPVPGDFRRPVRSAAPTLLVSGFLDPVTPPAFAEQVAQTLPNARLLVARGAAHGSVAACPLDAALFVLHSGAIAGMPNACR